MLRSTGATAEEMNDLFDARNLAKCLRRLRDMSGYDIRSFPVTAGKSRVAYRLVGKIRWNGGYRSFLGRSVA